MRCCCGCCISPTAATDSSSRRTEKTFTSTTGYDRFPSFQVQCQPVDSVDESLTSRPIESVFTDDDASSNVFLPFARSSFDFCSFQGQRERKRADKYRIVFVRNRVVFPSSDDRLLEEVAWSVLTGRHEQLLLRGQSTTATTVSNGQSSDHSEMTVSNTVETRAGGMAED